MNDKNKGLYGKYNIERTDGKNDFRDLNTRYSSEPSIWHGPDYFVLKLWDGAKYNRPSRGKHTSKPELAAIKAYIEACKDEYPLLAKDLEKYLPSESTNKNEMHDK